MAQVQALGGVSSFAHPSPPPSSPETSDFATISIGDDELWGPGPGRGGSKGGCCSCHTISQAYAQAQGARSSPADLAPTSIVMSSGANCTDQLGPGKLGGAGTGGGVMRGPRPICWDLEGWAGQSYPPLYSLHPQEFPPSPRPGDCGSSLGL